MNYETWKTERANITLDDMRSDFTYDPDSGRLEWARVGFGRVIGSEAGCINASGYRVVRYKQAQRRVHRLIWLYVFGEQPIGQIDHINGVRYDNRLSNLRDVSRSINSQNIRKPTARNSTGYLGVFYSKRHRKFYSSIAIGVYRAFLGFYDDARSAYDAYISAKRKYHKGNTL